MCATSVLTWFHVEPIWQLLVLLRFYFVLLWFYIELLWSQMVQRRFYTRLHRFHVEPTWQLLVLLQFYFVLLWFYIELLWSQMVQCRFYTRLHRFHIPCGTHLTTFGSTAVLFCSSVVLYRTIVWRTTCMSCIWPKLNKLIIKPSSLVANTNQ